MLLAMCALMSNNSLVAKNKKKVAIANQTEELRQLIATMQGEIAGLSQQAAQAEQYANNATAATATLVQAVQADSDGLFDKYDPVYGDAANNTAYTEGVLTSMQDTLTYLSVDSKNALKEAKKLAKQ